MSTCSGGRVFGSTSLVTLASLILLTTSLSSLICNLFSGDGRSGMTISPARPSPCMLTRQSPLSLLACSLVFLYDCLKTFNRPVSRSMLRFCRPEETGIISSVGSEKCDRVAQFIQRQFFRIAGQVYIGAVCLRLQPVSEGDVQPFEAVIRPGVDPCVDAGFIAQFSRRRSLQRFTDAQVFFWNRSVSRTVSAGLPPGHINLLKCQCVAPGPRESVQS